ncbi:MAG: phospholipid carrier-dependent glycosyltransferase [Gemmatimonadetes bacterium]|nr:phospholipid carrier-dependent glycosyltransferase [Gemmatimonadota bacterium]
MRALVDALRRRPELVLLTALALVTRLWSITYPPVVVWDEHHYTYFMGAYLNGTYIVDVHPPLGRLILAATAKLFGYNGMALWERNAAPLVRIVPAIFGAMIVPVVYALARALGGSRPVAAIVAAALVFDHALLVESRFALTDSALLLAVFTALLCDVLSDAPEQQHRRWLWLLAAAIAAGAAVSIKWTGLSALGVIGARRLFLLAARERSLGSVLRDGVGFALVAAAVYVGSFWMHFALLPDSGPGDGWMSDAFTKTLEGSVNHVHGAKLALWREVADIHKAMSDMNAAIGKQESAPSSPWYTWPIAKHSIVMWAPSGLAAARQRWILMFGNPVVWFGALAGMAVAGWAVFLRVAGVPVRTLFLLLAGYVINYAPFALIHRPMYLYHYLMPLVFSLLIAGLGAGPLVGWGSADSAAWAFRSKLSARGYWGLVGVMAVIFLYLAPMAYGVEMSASSVKQRLWVIERQP